MMYKFHSYYKRQMWFYLYKNCRRWAFPYSKDGGGFLQASDFSEEPLAAKGYWKGKMPVIQ